MTLFIVYLGDSIYGLSYTWDGAYRMVFNLPLGCTLVEEWHLPDE